MSKEKIKVEDSLAVKYRPKKLSDMVGDSQNISVIEGMFARRKMVKTYLLAGPTGSGKTTLARLIATAINCQNFNGKDACLKCKSCKLALKKSHPDIMEMNAGGEGGKVAELRRVLQVANLAPTFNYRVFLCDEIHGASYQGKQELLKPLEEPPPNTIWMLITSQPEKLSEAMYGRGLKLFLNYPSVQAMSKRLSYISKKEFKPWITKILKPFLPTIVEGCRCQPRDSISALENIATALYSKDYKNFSKSDVKRFVKKFLTTAGELDRFVTKFLAHLYVGKKLEPLLITKRIENIKVEEFVSLCYRYSYYASLYFLHKKKGNKIDTEGFWGVSFFRWNTTLKKLEKKVSEDAPLKMCSASVEATEKIRLGLIQPEQTILFMIQRFLNS